MVHNMLFFVQRVSSAFSVEVSFVLPIDVHLLQHHLLKRLSFLSSIAFCTFFRNQFAILLWGLIWDSLFCSVDICVRMSARATVLVILVTYLVSKSAKVFYFSHFLKCFSYSSFVGVFCLFVFHINFRVVLFILALSQRSCLNFYWNCINLNVILGENWHRTVLNLLVHEHGISLHFLVRVYWTLTRCHQRLCNFQHTNFIHVRFTAKYFLWNDCKWLSFFLGLLIFEKTSAYHWYWPWSFGCICQAFTL